VAGTQPLIPGLVVASARVRGFSQYEPSVLFVTERVARIGGASPSTGHAAIIGACASLLVAGGQQTAQANTPKWLPRPVGR